MAGPSRLAAIIKPVHRIMQFATSSEVAWVEAHLSCDVLGTTGCQSVAWIVTLTREQVFEDGWRELTCRLCGRRFEVLLPFSDTAYEPYENVTPTAYFKVGVRNLRDLETQVSHVRTMVNLHHNGVMYTAEANQSISFDVLDADVDAHALPDFQRQIEHGLKEDAFAMLMRHTFNVKVFGTSGGEIPAGSYSALFEATDTVPESVHLWRDEMQRLRDELHMRPLTIGLWPF